MWPIHGHCPNLVISILDLGLGVLFEVELDLLEMATHFVRLIYLLVQAMATFGRRDVGVLDNGFLEVHGLKIDCGKIASHDCMLSL
jgi:hypothetical protein